MPYTKGPFRFGKKSQAVRAELHPMLVQLFDRVILLHDCSLIDGSRSIEEQKANVANGVSQTMNSRHLPRDPVTGLRRDDGLGVAWAVDALPYPFVGWGRRGAESDLLVFGGFVLAVAAELGIEIRYGGDWNANWQTGDNGFDDLDHFELFLPKGAL